MLQRYAHRTCVLTASTQGIGLATAARFLLEGGQVVISSRKKDQVQEKVEELETLMRNTFEAKSETAVRAFFCGNQNQNNFNVGEASDMMKEMVKKKLIIPGKVVGKVCHQANANDRLELLKFALSSFQTNKIDVLVLNAAASTHYGEFIHLPEKSIDKMFETNVKSTILFAQEAKPFLMPENEKNENNNTLLFPEYNFSPCISITSSVGAYVPCSPVGFYSASKTMLLGVTKALAENYSHYGVRVNSVCPGVTRTRLAEKLVEQVQQNNNNNSENNNKKHEKLANAAGGLNDGGFMHRVGDPREVAAGIAFLCSRDASFITGENLVIGGGGFYHL
ncbi:short chain dehydrogenase/Enoyl-(Acyl carrier protein) reductase, putative [Angomonas deanei]|uniref:Short chain dehydrogenase/Enoyl-(Acyl carrier protein) reductase, putative n=1 Tax=Angomonas deanei TaxID=59799 RepID=A0A7G2CUR0_9TRYP|nr:short chain dehydrogenase/Enoyl-(Acyl carrier protein) reductase, putative [Angomonas deanei]